MFSVISTTDGSSVRYDQTPPTLEVVSVISNNTFDNSLAKLGDELTLTFTTNETVRTPTVTISGHECYRIGKRCTGQQ